MRMKNIYISVAILLNCTSLFSQTEKLVEYLTVPGYKEYSKIDLQPYLFYGRKMFMKLATVVNWFRQKKHYSRDLGSIFKAGKIFALTKC